VSVVSRYIPVIWAAVIIGILIYTVSVFIKPMIQIIQTIRDYREKNKLEKTDEDSEE